MMLKDLGVTPKSDCGCNTDAAEMDKLGPDGVRAVAAKFAANMRERARKLGWLAYAAIVAKAVKRGLVFDPRDPYTGMIEEACRRAEKKALVETP
jgi:hypothetical protein